MSGLTLHYWKIPGRASLAYLLLKVGGLPVEYVDEDQLSVDRQKEYKLSAPFGQVSLFVYLFDCLFYVKPTYK